MPGVQNKAEMAASRLCAVLVDNLRFLPPLNKRLPIPIFVKMSGKDINR